MRTAVAFAIGAVAAVAVSAAVAMTMNANDNASLAKQASIEATHQAQIADHKADQRVAAANARARAAEARVECEHDRQQASNRGAVVGGLAGAVIGSNVAGSGAKSEGGALGAVT